MKLWLDDVRQMPEYYDIWAKTSAEAIKLVETGIITEISFDHDLGGEDTGYIVACVIEMMAYAGKIGRMGWDIHSANPVGRERIYNAMKKAEEYWNLF